MKTHTHQSSRTLLLCVSSACLLPGLAALHAGDLIQLKPPAEPATVSGAASNRFGQPIASTNGLKLRPEPGEGRFWATGYRVDLITPEQMKAWTNRVSQAAESGDAAAQVILAMYLHDGSHGFPTNHVQAYKWAAVAAAQAEDKARRLVKEWQSSMSPKDVAAGQEAASAYMARRKKTPN